MKYRGKECESRSFADSTGEGTEFLQDGIVVFRQNSTAIRTSGEIAAEAAAAAEEAKRKALRDDVVAVLADLKAGTLTFNTTAQTNAIKKLARGLRFALNGDTD